MPKKVVVPPPRKMPPSRPQKTSESKNLLSSIGAAVLLICSVLYAIVKAPEIHSAFLRYKVGSKVYMIRGSATGGGGTGFAIKAPSGQSYIVTNSHVCEGALTESKDKTTLLVVGEDVSLRRKVIENSNFTDLCLLEGLPGIEGLSLGSEPLLGQTEWIVGHPLLRPLTISKGEVVGKIDVKIPIGVVETPEQALECTEDKNEIGELNLGFVSVKMCLNVTKGAYMSTATIFPGNSGSPMVSSTGAVVGVAFASDMTNWAYVVSLSDLKKFLRHY